MDSDLRPARCPFCGGEQCLPSYANPGTWVVICIGCGSRGPEKEARDESVTAWNTRHGAGDADHSPDAGKMADDRSAELTTAWMAGVERERDRAAEDSARLDYIERTFSGMTNRERYLPVTMIWGKGANGRTLREACDKYMAKDAARAGGVDRLGYGMS